jgi:hypothetical protein
VNLLVRVLAREVHPKPLSHADNGAAEATGSQPGVDVESCCR